MSKRPREEKKDRRVYRSPNTHPNGISGVPWPSFRDVILEYDTLFIDEAGMGAYAGPLHLAGVMCDSGMSLVEGYHDSKLLRDHERQFLYDRAIRDPHLLWCVIAISNKEMDELGSLGAAWQKGICRVMETMIDLSAKRGREIAQVIIDGQTLLKGSVPISNIKHVIKADQKILGVSIASVLAKVSRDREMVKLAGKYPPPFDQFFRQGKGYRQCAEHDAQMAQGNFTELHRRCFEPLKSFLVHKADEDAVREHT